MGRNISGLVDEQRPLMRHFGQTYFLPDGPGERAFFVAEELALEQAVGDAGRVHRDKGAGPAAAIVDVMGQQFLAHAGFPEDQHRGVGRAYLAAVRQQAAHDGTAVQQDFRRIPVGLGLRLFLFPGGKAGAQGAARHGERFHRREQDAGPGGVQLLCLFVEERVVADVPARDHEAGQSEDVLPAVPAVKAQQHIAADGEIKLCAGESCRQHLQREDGVVPPPLRSLLHLPAAHGQSREAALLRQRGKTAAHLQPQRTGSVRPPLERGHSGGHDHDPVRPDPRRRCPQIVQVAVVGRVEAAAVQQDFHFSRSA